MRIKVFPKCHYKLPMQPQSHKIERYHLVMVSNLTAPIANMIGRKTRPLQIEEEKKKKQTQTHIHQHTYTKPKSIVYTQFENVWPLFWVDSRNIFATRNLSHVKDISHILCVRTQKRIYLPRTAERLTWRKSMLNVHETTNCIKPIPT